MIWSQKNKEKKILTLILKSILLLMFFFRKLKEAGIFGMIGIQSIIRNKMKNKYKQKINKLDLVKTKYLLFFGLGRSLVLV